MYGQLYFKQLKKTKNFKNTITEKTTFNNKKQLKKYQTKVNQLINTEN